VLVKEVVLHALRTLDDSAEPFDAVAIVQCTSPFTAAGDVAGTIGLLDCTSGRTISATCAKAKGTKSSPGW
jgi:hypothetical protein